jgi:predicted AAA+ superfamily ATPase
MQRKSIKELILWKEKSGRMPLLVEGARQVGKTWLLREFGRTFFKNTVYVDFDKNRKVHRLFELDLVPRIIIEGLELESGEKILPGETLIIFDEIQECNRALVSLKYFCDEAPEYHIAAAGSLLGVALRNGETAQGFPVGKVDILHMYPMTFEEYLDAAGETRYQILLEKKNYHSSPVIADDLIRHLKYYLYIGGMPRAVQTFIDTGDLRQVRKIQDDIISNFEKDFSRHISGPSIPKIGLIWNSIPLQLAREKKQWIYRNMKEGARASQYEDALYWLIKAGLVYQIHKIETPGLPLGAYKKDSFKLYITDTGLLSAQAGLSIENLTEPDPAVFSHFRGALTEQFVLQELTALSPKPDIFYWENERNKGLAEVDFLIQYNGEIIPVEAKASINLQAKSLKTYINYYKPKYAVRTSLARFGRNKNLIDIPLYLIGQLPELATDRE